MVTAFGFKAELDTCILSIIPIAEVSNGTAYPIQADRFEIFLVISCIGDKIIATCSMLEKLLCDM